MFESVTIHSNYPVVTVDERENSLLYDVQWVEYSTKFDIAIFSSAPY